MYVAIHPVSLRMIVASTLVEAGIYLHRSEIKFVS